MTLGKPQRFRRLHHFHVKKKKKAILNVLFCLVGLMLQFSHETGPSGIFILQDIHKN